MPLVFVNGCFDILHAGHIRLLEWAADHGDVFVGLNSDASVAQLKGRHRPFYPEQERREILLALRAVTDVMIFDELTPERLIAAINPEVIVVGYDHSCDDSHYAAAAARGIRVWQAPHFPGYSTSLTAKRIQYATHRSHR